MDIKSVGLSGIPPAVPHKGRAASAKGAPEAAAPQDKVVKGTPRTTREQRIQVALAKAADSAAGVLRTGTSAYTGEIVGTALAFALVGGIAAPAIGGAVGAIAGLVLDRTPVGQKLHQVVGSGAAKAKNAMVHVGHDVKQAFHHVLDSIHPHAASPLVAAPGDKHAPSTHSATASGKAGQGKDLVTTSSPKDKEKASVLKSLVSGLGGVGKGFRSLPKILYPAISNATAAEKAKILETLDSLPLTTVASTESIHMSTTLAEQMNASGLARNLLFMKPIDLDKAQFAIDGFGKGTLIHEVGHTFDFGKGLPYLGASSKAPWGKGPYVFDEWIDTPNDLYASTNHFEDFAQSHKFFYENPEVLKATNPAKYEAMKKLKQPGLNDVLFDHPKIREIAKNVSAAIDKVPGLRVALDVAGTISGPLEMRKGAAEIQKGLKDGDAKAIRDGKLDLASGVAYATRTAAPLGLAVEGLQFFLNRQVEKGKMTPEKADRVATDALATMTGPVGLTARSAVDALLGGKHPAKIQIEVEKPKLSKLRKQQHLKRLLTGSGIGAAAGAIAGGLIGGLLGGPIGAAAGSALGAAAAGTTGAFLSQRGEKMPKPVTHVTINGTRRNDTDLTKADKIYLAKVGGGAVAGGIAGTALGWKAGALAGAAAGALVAGPLGAAIGGTLGAVGGVMAGSYAGSKAGAALGKALDHGAAKTN